MGLIAYYAIFIINIILVITNKRIKIIAFATFLFLGIIFCSNECVNGDWVNYKNFYDNFHVGSGMEIGYVAFGNLFKFLGLPFNAFLLFIYLACSIILYKGFKGYNLNYHILFSLLMPYIVPFLAFTLRYLIGLSIIIYAFLIYLRDGKSLKYLCLVVIAALFHKTMLLYVLLLLVNRRFTKRPKAIYHIDHKLVIAIFSLSIFISIIAIFNGNSIPFMMQFTQMISRVIPSLSGKLEYYLTTKTQLGFLAIYIIYFMGLACVIFINKKETNSFNYKKMQYRGNIITIDGCMQSFLIMSIFLPLVLVSLTFFRYFIVIYLLLCVGCSCSKKAVDSLDVRFVVFLAVLVWFISERMFLFSVDINNLVSHSFYFNWT